MNTSTPETAQEAACRLSAPMLDKGFKPVALHTYTDVDGNPIFYRIRVNLNFRTANRSTHYIESQIIPKLLSGLPKESKK